MAMLKGPNAVVVLLLGLDVAPITRLCVSGRVFLVSWRVLTVGIALVVLLLALNTGAVSVLTKTLSPPNNVGDVAIFPVCPTAARAPNTDVGADVAATALRVVEPANADTFAASPPDIVDTMVAFKVNSPAEAAGPGAIVLPVTTASGDAVDAVVTSRATTFVAGVLPSLLSALEAKVAGEWGVEIFSGLERAAVTNPRLAEAAGTEVETSRLGEEGSAPILAPWGKGSHMKLAIEVDALAEAFAWWGEEGLVAELTTTAEAILTSFELGADAVGLKPSLAPARSPASLSPPVATGAETCLVAICAEISLSLSAGSPLPMLLLG